MKRAIIDIGTNTAHLLIAEVQDKQLREVIFKERIYTFLGDDGLDRISRRAEKRLYAALQTFNKSLIHHQCHHIHVLATEALRAASNGDEIYTTIKNLFGWPLSIISGMEESELIYRGARLIKDLSNGSFLIMDIGGGSVEFIWVVNGQKKFQESYQVGISRLHAQYHRQEPCAPEDIDRMNKRLEKELKGLWNRIEKHPVRSELIGCAGTFEIFLSENEKKDVQLKMAQVPSTKLQQLYDQAIIADLKGRSMIQDLPKERTKYIVVALGLIKYMVDRMHLMKFTVSKYALKEGALTCDKYFLD